MDVLALIDLCYKPSNISNEHLNEALKTLYDFQNSLDGYLWSLNNLMNLVDVNHIFLTLQIIKNYVLNFYENILDTKDQLSKLIFIDLPSKFHLDIGSIRSIIIDKMYNIQSMISKRSFIQNYEFYQQIFSHQPKFKTIYFLNIFLPDIKNDYDFSMSVINMLENDKMIIDLLCYSLSELCKDPSEFFRFVEICLDPDIGLNTIDILNLPQFGNIFEFYSLKSQQFADPKTWDSLCNDDKLGDVFNLNSPLNQFSCVFSIVNAILENVDEEIGIEFIRNYGILEKLEETRQLGCSVPFDFDIVFIACAEVLKTLGNIYKSTSLAHEIFEISLFYMQPKSENIFFSDDVSNYVFPLIRSHISTHYNNIPDNIFLILVDRYVAFFHSIATDDSSELELSDFAENLEKFIVAEFNKINHQQKRTLLQIESGLILSNNIFSLSRISALFKIMERLREIPENWTSLFDFAYQVILNSPPLNRSEYLVLTRTLKFVLTRTPNIDYIGDLFVILCKNILAHTDFEIVELYSQTFINLIHLFLSKQSSLHIDPDFCIQLVATTYKPYISLSGKILNRVSRENVHDVFSRCIECLINQTFENCYVFIDMIHFDNSDQFLSIFADTEQEFILALIEKAKSSDTTLSSYVRLFHKALPPEKSFCLYYEMITNQITQQMDETMTSLAKIAPRYVNDINEKSWIPLSSKIFLQYLMSKISEVNYSLKSEDKKSFIDFLGNYYEFMTLSYSYINDDSQLTSFHNIIYNILDNPCEFCSIFGKTCSFLNNISGAVPHDSFKTFIIVSLKVFQIPSIPFNNQTWRSICADIFAFHSNIFSDETLEIISNFIKDAELTKLYHQSILLRKEGQNSLILFNQFLRSLRS